LCFAQEFSRNKKQETDKFEDYNIQIKNGFGFVIWYLDIVCILDTWYLELLVRRTSAVGERLGWSEATL
jgi:hypothetical protein